MEDEKRLCNASDQLRAAVAAKLLPQKHALAISPREHKAEVYSPFFKTDPKAAWYNHGKKVFYGMGRGVHGRAATLAAFNEAVKWVQDTYGYTGPWLGNALQQKVPAIVQKNFPIKRRPK